MVNGRMRTCKIHDLLRQLCLSEAHTENVVHVMNGNVLEAIDNQRRMILLSEVEEKHDYSMQHSSGIICTFISMQVDFPTRMCSIVSQFKLLKVLDVLSIEYDFSSVIPELVQLRYVAPNIEKALSLDKLRNLQTIILRRYFSVRPTTLEHPVEIWSMSETRHVDIWSMSNPVEAEQALCLLNNLQTLYLYNSPFVVEIIRRTPNLKKLKILDKSGHPDCPAIIDSLSLVQDLETLHIETLNIDSLSLEQLSLNELFELEEIPESIGEIMTLKLIQIEYCSSAVENSAKKTQQEQQSLGNYELQLQITPMVCSNSIFHY